MAQSVRSISTTLTLLFPLLLLLSHSSLCANSGYFWQLTDVHLQPQYYEGADVQQDCIAGTGSAGKFGTIEGKCDLPLVTVTSAYEFMSTTMPNPDFILYSGDMVPHNQAGMGKKDLIWYQYNITYYMKKYFPGTTVYPVLGNHDTIPRFQMYPNNYWLYDEVAEVWSPFLDEDMQATFKKGGYYTKLHAPGFRIVVANTAIYYKHNSFVDPKNNSDPGGQMAWLSDVLKKAKEQGERVLLMYHVPAGYNGGIQGQFIPEYNDPFVSIFDPFNSIIVGHFIGHNHLDFYRLFGDLESGSSTSVGFISGSLTEWEFVNPRVRLFQYLRDYPFTILDYTSYILDLVAANAAREITWDVEYQATTEYSLPDLSSSSMLKLWQDMHTNDTLFDRYMSHWKGMEIPIGELCGVFPVCKAGALCSIAYPQKDKIFECIRNREKL